MIVQTGLFLAVVAWIVGQWWNVIGHVPIAIGGIVEEGWVYCFPHFISTDRLVVTESLDRGSVASLFRRPPPLYGNGISASGFSFCGVTVLDNSQATSITFRHWLVVTIFALFNGALMWVHRTRGKADS